MTCHIDSGSEEITWTEYVMTNSRRGSHIAYYERLNGETQLDECGSIRWRSVNVEVRSAAVVVVAKSMELRIRRIHRRLLWSIHLKKNPKDTDLYDRRKMVGIKKKKNSALRIQYWRPCMQRIGCRNNNDYHQDEVCSCTGGAGGGRNIGLLLVNCWAPSSVACQLE